jgi:hypothetical protein
MLDQIICRNHPRPPLRNGTPILGVSAFRIGNRTNGNLKSKTPKFQIGPPERRVVLIDTAMIQQSPWFRRCSSSAEA